LRESTNMDLTRNFVKRNFVIKCSVG
jgi:hypothetical protein